MEDLIKIVKKNNCYIIQYKGQNLLKEERPTVWSIVKEPCQYYVKEEFAKSDIRSLKRYVTEQFNGDYEKWEKSNF